jgi:hypothetical protein
MQQISKVAKLNNYCYTIGRGVKSIPLLKKRILMKITQSEKALVEHYVYATAASAVAIYQTGNHHLKHILWAAIIGVVGPLLAKANPKGVVNDLAKKEHLDAVTTAALTSVATAAVTDAQKAVAQAAIAANVAPAAPAAK